ncbi:DNA-binding transcriptional MerR regulator [Pseudomonas nitritireducens]|uniref:DNA-binding transcriptional MerR regulator n=1 Tax=Pseudomonas nitroreducens TaxID=46680 RepID=A0A7W7KJG6_PSENT|nr:DNA-binding transcriptional MerR regulator [Pseudomonas nitritireducens]
MSTPLNLLQRLLQRPDDAPSTAEEEREYTVDELAREGGTTVRNLRAYQDRGLLPPPERRGRAGVYFASHLRRLRLINRLLERGYNIANIKELLESWESGHDLDHVLGLDEAIVGPWNLESPGNIEFSDLQALFGDELNDAVIDQALAQGLLAFDGERISIPSPRLFNAGVELYCAGIPLASLLDHLAVLRSDTEHLAAGIVRLVVTHLVDKPGADLLPGAADLERLAEVFQRLRPVAEQVVLVELARGLKRSANEMLGERVGEILRRLETPE